MKNSIFEYVGYKPYLISKTGSKGSRKGLRLAIANSLNCNTAYISHVLNGSSNFSLEQGEKLNTFLDHTAEESHFFLLLIQYERAGTNNLRKYFLSQIRTLREKRLEIKTRLNVKDGLTPLDQAKYYSSWYFIAIHVAISIGHLQSKEALASYFRLPLKKTGEILEFLLQIGLAKFENGRYRSGTTHIHLGNDSENIIRHHSNWRGQALISLDRERVGDLHYSGALSLSEDDAKKIKDLLIETIKKSTDIAISSSPEENVYCLNLDLFNLKQNYSAINPE